MRKNDRRALAAAMAMFLLLPGGAAANESMTTLGMLKQGQIVDGFETVALFMDDSDAPMGARLVHKKSGFTLDLLRIQSVPQGFIWVNSWPTSDMGEPHTQEHLLLGKGNKGRAVSTLDDMSLCQSTAYTEQWRTCYHFNTAAGPDVFFDLFERRVDAMLHPDYTDEEIRREVRNFGVARNPDGSLRLEEKGSVYNEMVSSFDNPYARLYKTLNAVVYGKNHPLSNDSGGLPEAIRVMRPEDIRSFHGANYHLGNMGMVSAFPKEMELGATLKRFDAILTRLEPDASSRLGTFKSPRDFPPARPEPAGTIRIVEYPDANAENASPLIFAWPADLTLDSRERLLAGLFVGALAGDQTSNLYKKLVDSTTREVSLGATNVFGYVNDDPGHSVIVGLTDVAPSHLTEAEIGAVRAKILDEIARVASTGARAPSSSSSAAA
jgi:Zn-dependent M16 (insulinase) family peptidase